MSKNDRRIALAIVLPMYLTLPALVAGRALGWV